MEYQRVFSAVVTNPDYVYIHHVQYFRLGPKCGLLEATFRLNSDSSSAHGVLSLYKMSLALGLSFKNPASVRNTGTWWYNDGDNHPDRYGYGTVCQVNTSGYVELARIYDASGNIGSWEHSSLGKDRYFTVSGIYLEEN